MRPVRQLLVLLALGAVLGPGLAFAGPAAAADRAERVHARHCATVASAGEASLAAAAMAEVAAAWSEVLAADATSDEAWLPYWTGLLAECLGHRDEASRSLLDFLGRSKDDGSLNAMREDARRRLRRAGVAVPDEAAEASPLSPEAGAEELWSRHCRRRAARPEPSVLEALSRAWGRLATQAEAPREVALLRARLAICLGQEEYARADLLLAAAPVASPGGLRQARTAARLLARRDVHLDLRLAPVSQDQVPARRFHLRPRFQIALAGGVAGLGVDTSLHGYVGLDVSRAQPGVFGDWWVESPGGRPATSEYQQLLPTLGIRPAASLDLILWTPHVAPARRPQLGIGVAGRLRGSRAVVRSWTLEAEIDCLERNPSTGACREAGSVRPRPADATTLSDRRVPRLVVGPRIALRLLPERRVTPVIDAILPAVDLGLLAAPLRCTRSIRTPGRGLPSEWTDVTLDPVADAPGDAEGTSLFIGERGGAWQARPQDPDDACISGESAPLFVTARLGLGIEARPIPRLSIRVHLEAEPLLWDDAVEQRQSFPQDGVHLGAIDAVVTGGGIPILLDLVAGIAVSL